MSGYAIKLVSGSGNPALAAEIAHTLGLPLEEAKIGSFADGECNLQIINSVRGADVFLIQPTCKPVNDNVMQLLLTLHTLMLSSAKRVTAVIPYFGYARQDRKVKPRVPISASLVAQLIETVSPHRCIILDLHCGQIQGFFHSTPVDNLYADRVFLDYVRLKRLDPERLVTVSPDAGGVARARRMADSLAATGVVTILKRRVKDNQVDSMQIIGDVAGMVCVICDDMVDTAGTLCKAALLLKEHGAEQIIACITHGLFSGDALSTVNASVISEIAVTDSIPQAENQIKCDKLVVLSVAPLLAETVRRIHNEESVSSLFRV